VHPGSRFFLHPGSRGKKGPNPGSGSATLVPAFSFLQKPNVPALALLDPDICIRDPDPLAKKSKVLLQL
jgi:hypothetical protein